MPGQLRALYSILIVAITVGLLTGLLIFGPLWLLMTALVALLLGMVFTRTGMQSWSVTRMGLATLPMRLGSSSVIVVGVAGVVGVLVALLAMGQGFENTLRDTGTQDTAIITRAGSLTEVNSVLDLSSAEIAFQAPQVARNAQGQTIASPELVVIASIPKKSNHLDANVEMRGIGERGWELRSRTKIIEGRTFTPGLRELIVGKGTPDQFMGLDIGSTLMLNGQVWSVVGVFDAHDAHNSELWADAGVMASTYHRNGTVNSATVRLVSPDAFVPLKALLTSDRRLKVDVATTRDYYGRQSAAVTHLIRTIGVTIGIIMALGAVFGALNTMYSAVAARTKEIATLRAIGFQGESVVVSVLLETALLALCGGLLGVLVSWILFHDYTASTLGANFSQLVFAFTISPALLWSGLKWALAIGLVGGLLPALRAAQMSVVFGLRDS